MSEQDERPEPVQQATGPVASDLPGLGQSVESTGDDRVDQALTRLGELDDMPVHEHATVVEAIHRSLQDTLAEDEG